MKARPEQLPTLLTKKISDIYLVSGDEFLLVQEACDTITKHLTNAGYQEKETYHVDHNFNWETLLGSMNNCSLFSDQKIIELRIKGKISDAGKKIIQNYCKNPLSDTVILMVMDKLDGAQQKSAWFNAIDSAGVITQVWPIELNQLPTWISNRLNAAGLKTDHEGLQLLTEHVAGNLLAAIQEIEKLKLLYGEGIIKTEQINDAIADNSRFNVFSLLDTTLNGDTAATSRILDNLKSENVEPTIILWAITKELRTLINIKTATNNGTNLEAALTQNGIWQKRKPPIKTALSRINLNKLSILLKYALNIDMIIKGADNQRQLWHELKKLYLKAAS